MGNFLQKYAALWQIALITSGTSTVPVPSFLGIKIKTNFALFGLFEFDNF
jgi:hypothetical protein